MYEIAKRQQRLGHAVTVYTTDWGISSDSTIRNQPVSHEGIRIYYFSNLSEFLAQRKIIIPVHAVAIMKEMAAFDIVHIHEHRTLLAAAASYFAKRYDVPSVVQPHGSLPLSIGNHMLYRIFYRIVGEKILLNARKIIALNISEIDQLRILGIPSEKYEIIPNGIDLETFAVIPDAPPFRTMYGISEEERMILYLGRLNRTKGIDILIRAFGSIANRRGDIRLVISGADDGYLSAINDLVKDLGLENRVILTGILTEEMKRRALREADIFVLPSRYDAFPVTVLEAWASSTPVITTKHCGSSDLVRRAGGPVVEGDEVSIASAINQLLDDREMIRIYMEKARDILIGELELGEDYTFVPRPLPALRGSRADIG